MCLAEVKNPGMQILDPVMSNPIFTSATYDSWLALFGRTNPTSQPRPRTKLERKGASELSGVDWIVSFSHCQLCLAIHFTPLVYLVLLCRESSAMLGVSLRAWLNCRSRSSGDL